jgi:hypothetical protein
MIEYKQTYDDSPTFTAHVNRFSVIISSCRAVGWGFVIWIEDTIDEGGWPTYVAVGSGSGINWTAQEAQERANEVLKPLLTSK